MLTRYADVAGTALVGTTAYGYDAAGRVVSITNKNASAALLSSYGYTYDVVNRVTSEAWQSVTATGTLSGTHNYSYDVTNQLTADGATPYSYDANGNRTMTGYQTGANNHITNDGTFAYTYDAVGDIIEKSKSAGLETWYYGYDTLNRLTSIRKTSDGYTNMYTVAYTYDVLGNRSVEDVWQAGVGETVTRTAFDGGQAWADLTTANVVTTRYVWGAGGQELYARIDVGAGLRQVSQDRLGSVRDVWDGSGVSLDHVEYAAYGAISSETAAGLGGHYLYTGLGENRYTDTVTADYRTEFVDIGRWLQPDPITFSAGDGNLYRYVGNNPTNLIDPSGLTREYWTDYIPVYPAIEIVETLWEMPKLAREGRILEVTRQAIVQDSQKSNPNATIIHTGNGDPAEEELNRLSARSPGFAGQLGTHWGQSYAVAGAMAGAFTREMIRSVGEKVATEIITNYVAGRVPQFVEFLQEVKGWKAIKNGDKIVKIVTAEGKEVTKEVLTASAKEFKAVKTFKSFDALKRELGAAGEGQVWHHIVEQRAANVERFGAEAIHNTSSNRSAEKERMYTMFSAELPHVIINRFAEALPDSTKSNISAFQ